MLEFCCGMPSLLLLGGAVAFFFTFWKNNGLIRDTLCLGANITLLGGAAFALHAIESTSLFWALLAGNLIGCVASYAHRHKVRGNMLKVRVVTRPVSSPRMRAEEPDEPSEARKYVERMLIDLEVAKETKHLERYEALHAQLIERGRKEYGEAFELDLKRATERRDH